MKKPRGLHTCMVNWIWLLPANWQNFLVLLSQFVIYAFIPRYCSPFFLALSSIYIQFQMSNWLLAFNRNWWISIFIFFLAIQSNSIISSTWWSIASSFGRKKEGVIYFNKTSMKFAITLDWLSLTRVDLFY